MLYELVGNEKSKKQILILMKKKSLNKKFRKLREDFTANVSHELKTPLTIIKGSVETLLKGALKNPEEAEHFVKIIAKHTDRLNILINDILSLSNIEQKIKKKNISPAKYKVYDLIEDALCLHSETIKEKYILVTIHCDKSTEITANKHLLELALSNLISNAEQYNHKNGFIKIKVEKVDREIQISITDSGIGIRQKHIPRLFERFYRVDKIKSRNIGGTGLGLSIVKQIVKAHKGSITVSSKLGEGSTFTIIIPEGKSDL